ncbi:porin family protein [Rhodomicrobium vannielii ATCC 17100]|uniref:outer membrane protein n=1 Tax=Rhodomicrobium vannielii TaxID=1069 RepID=UPI0019181676|nr:outer membrane protein [Rhodomicrobium vannielii]MBJ7532862.1 porin family protein [Rhodomicrobium vannielii ATCC 17100]
MKKILLTVASVVALSSSAFAADLYKGGLKDAPVYEAPATWTGFYVGAHGGYGFGDLDGQVFYKAPTGAISSDIAGKEKTDIDGGFGGGQIGYNKQIDRLVIGIEADISGIDISGDNAFTAKYGDATWKKNFDVTVDYFGTVRGRVGYAFGSVLPYLTGGFAWGHAELDNNVFYKSAPAASGWVSGKGDADATLTGWTAGAGVEALVGSNWSVKAEYLYVDLGEEDFGIKGDVLNAQGQRTAAFDTDHYKGDVTFHTVRLGLNYKLGGTVYEPLK